MARPPHPDTATDADIDALAAALLPQLLEEFGGEEEVLQVLASLQHETALEDLRKFHHPPVGPREFVESPEYMDAAGTLWPAVMDCLEEMCDGTYVEAVMTGGIGCGKTTVALYAQAYQIYLLSCMRSPHREFDLDPATEIGIIFQSLNAQLAKGVDYKRFREMISTAPYFQRHFAFDENLESEMRFPRNIVAKPLTGSATAAIGQNILGGVIDEINFMQVVESSKQASDGGTYDQAAALYNSIRRRRESRFMKKGWLPGLLCLVSSKRYPGEFTERKANEADRQIRDTGSTRIYIYDKRIWEIRPEKFNQGTFQVFAGDQMRRPRILKTKEEKEELKDDPRVVEVPEDYREPFEDDILDALRDIAGMSTLALNPFIPNVDKAVRAFGKVPSILSRDSCDFVSTLIEMYPKRYRNPTEPRFVHLDLAISGDRAGMACGYVERFVRMKRADYLDPESEKAHTEFLPVIDFDFLLDVQAPRGGEINYGKLRTIIYRLRETGINVKFATCDSFQSHDMIQILRSKGLVAGLQSVDKTSGPYEVLKTALMDGRVVCQEHERAVEELSRLERDPLTQKIDHPANGSKDVTDAMAGVVYGLSTRREVWARHNAIHLMPVALGG